MSKRASSENDELIKRFDNGDDLSDVFDFENGDNPNLKIKRVNIDFPQWIVDGLDAESERIGVSRQAIVKMWIAERLDAR